MNNDYRLEIGEIYKRLHEFSDDDLMRFCLINFREVGLKLNKTQEVTAKVNILVDYCLRKKDEYERLADLLNIPIDQGNGIPIAVVAMNIEQAQELRDTSFNNNPLLMRPEDIELLQNFQIALREYKVNDISCYYDHIREHWKPYFQDRTIKEIIESMILHINSVLNSPIRPEIYADFWSEDFCTNDKLLSQTTWISMNQMGGVCIIDATSMLHPAISKIVAESGIASNPHVAILIIPPLDKSIIANQIIEDKIRQNIDIAFTRFDTNLDRLCELNIRDISTLRRYLSNILLESSAIVSNQRCNPNNRFHFRKQKGTPTGIGSKFLGKP